MTRRLALALLAGLLACGREPAQAPAGGSSPAPAPTPTPTPSPAAAPGAAATLRYVALGDSAGFGVGALPGEGGYPPRLARRIRDAGRAVELVNLSVPGARLHDFTTGQLPRAVEAAAGRAVDLFTVCLGGNDAGDAAPADFERDLDALLAGLAPLGGKVVVCNVPDVSLTPKVRADPARAAAVRANTIALNDVVARVVARRGDAVVDLFATSQQIYSRPELVWIDGFHPSAAGYELWADAMWPVVKAALGIQ